jgi:hypothetical protein
LESNPAEVYLVTATGTGVVQSATSISYVTVNLTNSVDGAHETLDASPVLPIMKQYNSVTHVLMMHGIATAEQYSEALKTVKYQHELMTDVRTMTIDSIDQLR